MQTSKMARIGQLPVWAVCCVVLVIAGCFILQPQDRFNRTTEDAVADGTIIYASVPADEITVHTTKTGRKFHRSGCRYLKKSNIPLPLLNAKNKGLTACKVCKPPQ